MGLADYQRLLARLYTEAGLRDRLRDDPEGLGAEFALDAEESAALSRLSPGQVGQFAGSLLRKRLGEVETSLPLSHRALGAVRFAALFRRYASGSIPSGIHKHRDDALAFAAFLERTAQTEPIEPTWVLDLVRQEAAGLTATGTSRTLSVRWFRYHLDDLAARVLEGDEAAAPRARRNLVAWFRFGRRGRLRRLVVAWPSRRLHWRGAGVVDWWGAASSRRP